MQSRIDGKRINREWSENKGESATLEISRRKDLSGMHQHFFKILRSQSRESPKGPDLFGEISFRQNENATIVNMRINTYATSEKADRDRKAMDKALVRMLTFYRKAPLRKYRV